MVQVAPAAQSSVVKRTGAQELSHMRHLFERAQDAFYGEPFPSYGQRMQRLQKLLDLVRNHQDRIAQSVSQDFGNRSQHETRLAEIFTLISSIKYMRKHLRSWMKPRPRQVGPAFQPGRARVQFQPLGVVGVIAPWNYPVNLALEPVASALAAGNRVLLKPSELTPHTAELLEELLAQAFDSNLVSVITGGPEIARAFSELPFDHLLYTGSTRVGKLVMEAAAKNLTPVTLELGGKSPAIIHPSYAPAKAAQRIAAGKWFNAGQTCVAPDYVLVHSAQRDALVAALVAAVSGYYPSLEHNPDYTSVINAAHVQRLHDYIDDAESKGARAIQINPAAETFAPDSRKFPPTLLIDVKPEMKVMQEEIFGPVLAVVSYDVFEDALHFVRERPRPLALYYFDSDSDRIDQLLDRTLAGGVCVNETNFHFGVDDLPFGGVGASGMGRYHGPEGFATFSHAKAVFIQSRWSGSALIAPPYGAKIERLLKLFMRL